MLVGTKGYKRTITSLDSVDKGLIVRQNYWGYVAFQKVNCPTDDERFSRIIREDYEGSILSGPKDGLRVVY